MIEMQLQVPIIINEAKEKILILPKEIQTPIVEKPMNSTGSVTELADFKTALFIQTSQRFK